MSEDKNNQELMQFLDEAPSAEKNEVKKAKKNVWRILITDDEKDVHSATTFALRNTKILGRRLEFLHASSAREAKEILENNDDIAVIILDVVMETPNAGLDLVVDIRENLKINDSRIILRTGQPNQAPEIEVIRDYDINDYKLKSELTQTKLFAALTTAVRSYKQIRMIETGKESLGLIVKSSAELLSRDGLNSFAHGVILHLAGLMSVPAEGLICVRRNREEDIDSSQIIAAAGDYCVLIDHPLSELVDEDAREPLMQSLTSRSNVFSKSGVALYLGSDARGDMSCYVANCTNLDDLDAGLLELFCNNISVFADNLTLVEKLKNQAYFDSLVELPNKLCLAENIDKKIRSEEIAAYTLAIFVVEELSEVNASLGYQFGDVLLQTIGARVKNKFSSSVVIARISGDTFALLGPDEEITEASVLSCFKDPYNIGEQSLLLTVSVGLLVLSADSQNGYETIKDITVVLNRARKFTPGIFVNVTQEMLDDAASQLNLIKNISSSLELERLYLAFQPKFSFASGKVTGLEALVRWRSENGEVILPENFIPLAEKSGLIIKLGEWILRSALAVLAKCHAAGFVGLDVSVNISSVQFRHADFLKLLDKVVADSGISPQRVDLEITESIAMKDFSSSLSVIQEVKKRGFKLSVDDFGTGLSSLSYLQKMSADSLKIDQSFVQQSDTEDGEGVVKMIIQMAKALNLNVIAEGVESEHQKEILSALGCDELQGFLLAQPMREQQLLSWLNESATQQKTG